MPLEHETIRETPFYTKTEDTTTATTTASLSSYSSVSPYLSSYSPTASWTISFGPKDREITIRTEASFIPFKEEADNAVMIEECLREKVAADLARQLLDEDLIQIQGITECQVDGSTVYKMKAEVKIIQE